jgi:hypothetical protein
MKRGKEGSIEGANIGAEETGETAREETGQKASQEPSSPSFGRVGSLRQISRKEKRSSKRSKNWYNLRRHSPQQVPRRTRPCQKNRQKEKSEEVRPIVIRIVRSIHEKAPEAKKEKKSKSERSILFWKACILVERIRFLTLLCYALALE